MGANNPTLADLAATLPSPRRSIWTMSPKSSGGWNAYGRSCGRGSPCGSTGPISRKTVFSPSRRPLAGSTPRRTGSTETAAGCPSPSPYVLSAGQVRPSAKGTAPWIGSRLAVGLLNTVPHLVASPVVPVAQIDPRRLGHTARLRAEPITRALAAAGPLPHPSARFPLKVRAKTPGLE